MPAYPGDATMRPLTLRLAVLGLSLFAIAGLTAFSAGQDPKESKDTKDTKDTKKPTRPATEVEIQFANGSTVRMILADTPVEVLTPYGKLAIPAHDLKKV